MNAKANETSSNEITIVVCIFEEEPRELAENAKT